MQPIPGLSADQIQLLRRYGIALFSTAIALLITQLFATRYHQGIVFVMLGAVMFAAWYGGRGPGLAASAAAAVGSLIFIVPSTLTVVAADVRDAIRLALFVGVALLIVELTHRQQKADALLGESERRYRTLFEQNPLPTCIFDAHSFRVLEVNRAMEAERGLPRSQLLGQQVDQVRAAGIAARLTQESWSAAIDHGLWRSPNGETGVSYLHARSYPIEFQGRKARLLVCQDVTTHVAAEQHLEEQLHAHAYALIQGQQQLRSLVSQLTHAEAQERKRLATELHDNLAQLLVLARMHVDRLRSETTGESAAGVRRHLKQLLDEAVQSARTLLSGLGPPPLTEKHDLMAALHWVVETMRRHHLVVTTECRGTPVPLEEHLVILTYQAVQELLFNVVKHAETNRASLQVEWGQHVVIAVQDGGRGFEGDHPPASKEGGFGLPNIRERITVLGGSLDVSSTPGVGTRVTLCLPKEIRPVYELSADSGSRCISSP